MSGPLIALATAVQLQVSRVLGYVAKARDVRSGHPRLSKRASRHLSMDGANSAASRSSVDTITPSS